MSFNGIKFGFLIKDGKIYDTKIQSYELKRKYIGNNVIYYMQPNKYKRLDFYEPLLYRYSIDEVFSLLNFNKYLEKQRKLENKIQTNKLHNMANMSVIYNYPPSYLTQKKFSMYKICQALKKRLD